MRRLLGAPRLAVLGSAALGLAILAGAASAEEPQAPRADQAPRAPRADRATYVEAIRRTALEKGVPPDLAEAVAQIESGFDPDAVGAVGEVGLMQVRPATAAMLGFAGQAADLARPDENVRYGVTYLAGAWRLAEGNVCRALMKYRAGHNAEVMSPLSASYCQRARTYLAGLASPLAGGVGAVAAAPAPASASAPAGAPAARSTMARLPACKRGTPSCSRAFWALHEARIRRIVAQLHAGRPPRAKG